MPRPLLLAITFSIAILHLPTSLAEEGGSLHKPPVGSLGNLPGQLAQLFLWSMDNFDKKMAEQDRYGQLEEQEEALMPPALAAKSSFPGSVANLHPVGNTANLPKWLVKQYTRSMERRSRGLSTSMDQLPGEPTMFTNQPPLAKTSSNKLLATGNTETRSLMSKANPKEAQVPTSHTLVLIQKLFMIEHINTMKKF